jgi:hypothetical protein
MLLSKGYLIPGGSSEVQLNIIAKRVLGLPDRNQLFITRQMRVIAEKPWVNGLS